MKEYMKQILSISAICIFLLYGCGPAHTSTKYDANGEILNDGYSSIVSSDNSQPISKKTKEERHYNNVYELLETVSGVFVDGRTVRVRGINSVNGNTAPLILMDGNEINLDLINPEDIHSVEVLKDSAATIYGMRGANGVILFISKNAYTMKQQAEQERRAQREAARKAKKAK